MAKSKITIKEIKEQVILPALSTTSFRYKVFASAGAYQNSYTAKNLRVGTVHTLIETTDSDIALLGGGINAVAMNVRIMFLIPVDDDANADGEYNIVERFRDELSDAFTMAKRAEIKLNGKTFIGAVSVGLPVGGQLLQRQGIGTSFEYTCYLEIAFLENAINSSDVHFWLDGDEQEIPFTNFSFSRKNTLTANLYSNTNNQESKTFAENSTFGVDLSMPAIFPGVSPTGNAINSYLLGIASANEPHTLRMRIGSIKEDAKENVEYVEKTETVIFGEVVSNGGGLENVSWQVSFVPYIEAEEG